MGHGHETKTGTGIKPGYEFISIFFEDKKFNYMLGFCTYIIIAALTPIIIHLFLNFIPCNWWIVLASMFIGWGVLDNSLVEVEKTEELLITMWNDPCAVVGAGRWWLPFRGFLFDCSPEHKTNKQDQSVLLKIVKNNSNDHVIMIGSGSIIYRIINSGDYMMVEEAIVKETLAIAGESELQQAIQANTANDGVIAGKNIRNSIINEDKESELYEVSKRFGIKIISANIKIEKSPEFLSAVEKKAVESRKQEVLNTRADTYKKTEEKVRNSNPKLTDLEVAQIVITLMDQADSYNFIGHTGDFTTAAAITSKKK